MVATSQPLAVEAGRDAFKRGGNAVDAALAAAITLVVVEPTNNGLGSDAFALVDHGGELSALNASGKAPAAMTAERYRGMPSMPSFGWESVTVPGAVSGWVALSERFGRLPFGDLFEHAIRHAREGFAVSPVVARQWQLTVGLYTQFAGFADMFLPGGKAPEAGQTVAFGELAESLQEVASTRGESLYRGRLARAIAADSERACGPMIEADLAAHRAEWVEPLGLEVCGVRLHELPPNSQGLAALSALGILENTRVRELEPDSGLWLHLQIEAMKLAFADTYRYLADPSAMELPAERLLDRDYLAERAACIDLERAGEPTFGLPGVGDTVYVCAADQDGTMVSFIQSNFFGFGSGVVVPGTGISLQNRASGFCLDAGHPNCVAGGRRPLHTNMPALVTDGAEADLAFGVMGAEMQPQGHVQMMLRVYAHGQSLQEAAVAPRWRWQGGRTVALEPGFSPGVRAGLERRGHRLQDLDPLLAGGAQLIRRVRGGYEGASEPRKDGMAAGCARSRAQVTV